MDDEAGPGVPEWVVTYGDMMSLLLTFFIMLVSLSDVVADDKYQAILSALQKYVFSVGYETSANSPPGENFPLNSFVAALETLGSFTDDDVGYGGVRQQSVEGPELKVYRTREGESRIARRPVLFSPFDVTLDNDAKLQLRSIAAELAGKPNKIVIRGHAAPAQLPSESPYADKIALTYERARNSFLFLVAEGVDYKRLRIEALADTEPPRAGRPSSQLDRVEVIILNAFADEFVGPREISK
jgi:chemotaxis protein MotB